MTLVLCFPGGAVVKNLPANAKDSRDAGSISRSGRSPGGGNGNPLQYSCLENPMDRGGLQSSQSVQLLSHVQLFATPWTTAYQVSLSFIISQNLLKLKSIKLMMSSNHLIFCHPLLLLSSVFPSIRAFSNELALCIRWPKYWNVVVYGLMAPA